MRLLMLRGNGDLSLTKDLIKDVPPYAILSHTWGDDDQEVTFKDVEEGTGRDKAGYRKIQFCGQQALSDGLQYLWVDTCCIDKSNNTELCEAINSMFKWYQKATRCYVYLSDVSKGHCAHDDGLLRSAWKLDFRNSRWFTRGWTLQELIAPSSVEFFSAEGHRLGDKNSLEQLLHEITRIPIGALRGRALSELTVDERMSWSQGRETKREEDRAYSLLGIFNVHLPPIYGEGVDNAFTRLREEISKRSTIGGSLIDEKAEMRKELLELLYFDEIDARLLTLKAAHNKTCQWFLEKEQYKAWMTAEKFRDHHGFIWIKGKPGAGKSTLMKFLDSEAKKAAKSEPNALVASFFFNARGDPLEKSTIGLYRSLLWQLFEKAEDLQGVLDEFDSNARRIIQRDGWQLEILKETLAKAVEGLGCRTLQFFIDALDECHDDDVADMISFFEDIGERAVEANVRLHICFSSRHYPTIVIRWGTQIVLEDEDEHGTDITRYIKSKLKLANARRADSLRSQIREKSAGVFLWVALVIPMLNKASAKGRVDELQKCLNGIPPGLDNLFEMILTRDREEMQEFRLCVQWILFAKRPLKLMEYFFAIRSPSPQEASRSRAAGDLSTEDMCRFVHSSSKGLAEVTKTRNKDKMPTIQFIHESVRDFFLVKHGDRRLWPNIDGRFVAYSHEVLRDRCLAEIYGSTGSSTLANLLQSANLPPPTVSSQMKFDILEHEPLNELLPKASSPEAASLRRSVSNELPFLEYAVHHVIYHAEFAEDATQQETFIRKFPLIHWIYLDNLFARYQTQRHTPSASLLYILAERNLPRLIKCELRRLPNMDILGERHRHPLFAACANGNQDAIVALLMQETKPQNDQNLALQLSYLREFKPRRGQTPLLYAAMNGYEDIVKLLLETNKVNADFESDEGLTPLSHAAASGHENIVKLLLEMAKVNADSKSNLYRTPLSYAAERGHEGIIKLLLETSKVNADSKSSRDRTPLSYAAENGYEGIIKLLLKTGKVDADSKDLGDLDTGRTPLSYAAEEGHEGIVRLLLGTGKVNADSKTTGTYYGGRTPLSFAAEKGHKGIVKLLLETGKVDADSKANSTYYGGRTPLLYAAAKGHEGIVKILLDMNGVDADSKANDILDTGRTPLSYAAENGHEGIVKLLLETEKVDVDSKVYGSLNGGRTPLSFAAEEGYEGIVKLLLEMGKANADSKTNGFINGGRTPLSYAAERGHEGIVKLLLETGKVDADSKNRTGQTPRSYASKNGYEDILKLL
ncbi:hypothetical protein DL769_000691 [Monosporascus sp. CRB-8-3]|nr:hypothetical protein DL769_000691 [Monosporascus sp. CRB-8-3]